MKLRINVGVEWGKILSGKKRVHKGYRPMRRVIQVRGNFLTGVVIGVVEGGHPNQFLDRIGSKILLLTSNLTSWKSLTSFGSKILTRGVIDSCRVKKTQH